jgi:hypothetical protein
MLSPSLLIRENPVLKTEDIEKPGLRRLPLFGRSLILYGLGLLTSAVFANGNPARVFWLIVSFLLFWVVVVIGRKTTYLYYLGLGLCTFLMVVGWVAAANVDDDNLRNNFISEKILKLDQLISPRLPGLQMHRNTLAGMLAVFGVLSLSYALFSRQPWVRWLGRGNCLVMFGLLLITNSRSGLLAFLAGGILLVGLSWPERTKKYRLYLLGWGLGFLALTGWYLVASGQYQLFEPERLLNENGISRIEIWQNTLYMLGDVPLTGFGPGNFKAVYPFYIDPSEVSGRVSQEHAHNIFLQIYGETGILGLLGIIGVFGVLVRLFLAAIRKKNSFTSYPTPSHNDRAVLVGWGGLAAAATMFFFGLTEFNPWNEQFTFLFWFPIAMIAGVYKLTPAKPALSHFTGRFRSSPLPVRMAALIAGMFVVVVMAWQLCGLTLVNVAGLTSQRVWLGESSLRLEVIEKLYQGAEFSAGWTGVPRRGEAWASYQKNDAARAKTLLQQVIQNQPDDTRSLLLLGDLTAASGNTNQALPLWQRAGAAPLFIDRGRRLFDTDDDLSSEPYFLLAIEIDPHLWDGYRFLVSLYQRHGRTPEAIALLTKASQIFPNDPQVQNQLDSLKAAYKDSGGKALQI